jgi:hypothetical protein
MDVKKLRLEFLEEDPVCLVCGGRANHVLLMADRALVFCDTDCISRWHEARMDYILWKGREDLKEMIREMHAAGDWPTSQ